MKKIWLSFLLLFLVMTCRAQVIIYRYSALNKAIGGGNDLKTSMTGKMFYSWQSTNSVNVIVDDKNKRLWVVQITNQVATTITGKGKETFTALAFVPVIGNQNNTIQYIGSPTIGKNESLVIAKNMPVTFPRVFNHHLLTLSLNSSGDSGLTQTDEVYTYLQSATQSANAQSQTIDAAVNAMVEPLEQQGYQLQ
jgi:hypothetical protein